jgi:hypothetical protein
LQNVNVDNYETKLQKEVVGTAEAHKELLRKQEEEKANAKTKTLEEVEEDDEDAEKEEPMPKSVV